MCSESPERIVNDYLRKIGLEWEKNGMIPRYTVTTPPQSPPEDDDNKTWWELACADIRSFFTCQSCSKDEKSNG